VCGVFCFAELESGLWCRLIWRVFWCAFVGVVDLVFYSFCFFLVFLGFVFFFFLLSFFFLSVERDTDKLNVTHADSSSASQNKNAPLPSDQKGTNLATRVKAELPPKRTLTTSTSQGDVNGVEDRLGRRQEQHSRWHAAKTGHVIARQPS